jgi:hypothetical protein
VDWGPFFTILLQLVIALLILGFTAAAVVSVIRASLHER